jgi:hypothetical protein
MVGRDRYSLLIIAQQEHFRGWARVESVTGNKARGVRNYDGLERRTDTTA